LQPVFTTDECVAFDEAGEGALTHETFNLDLGEVTMSVENSAPIKLPENIDGFEFIRGCYRTYNAPPHYLPGDSVKLNISGGADFPELVVDTTIPQPLNPSYEGLVPGEPWEFHWEPGASNNTRVSIFADFKHENGASSTSLFVICNTDDDGAFTIPRAFTELFSESSYIGNITIERHAASELTLEDASMPVVVDAEYSVTKYYRF
jgi:hypothetical protein